MFKKIALASAFLLSTGAASAQQYYDCTSTTGCSPVKDITVKSDYAKTKNPIVLGHGTLFTSKVFGLEWWYGIPRALTKNGAQVFSVEQSSFNNSYVRGEQIRQQVSEILAITGAEKVNLMGHSHGGNSGRYMVATHPEVVASLTAIGTPHKGSEAGDFVKLASVTLGQGPTDFVANLLNGLGNILNFFSGKASDYEKDIYTQKSLDAMEELITSGSKVFNEQFPAGIPATACGEGDYEYNGIKLYSWSGATTFNNILDPLDYVLGLTGTLFKEKQNDGLAGRCSTHFGKVIRDDYRMNHADEVNQLLGLVAIFETNPTSVYQQQANRLKNDGL